ncbi:MAG: lambda exonuclease family protein [Pseudonocardiaceae bacterium]
MTLRILDNLQQGSEAWHDQRRGMVTASVVGNLLSVGKLGAIGYGCPACSALANDPCVGLRSAEKKPIKTLHPERAKVAEDNKATAPLVIEVANNETSRSLTKLLTAERLTGYTEPTFTSDDMYRGQEDEPRARDLYSEHHASATVVGFMVRDDWGFPIGYSPDGLVGDDGLIEIKSRRQKNHLATVLADKVPADNMAQLQCGLLVSGRSWIDYVSYCGGMPLWAKRVYPDQQWFDAITQAVRTFESAAEDMANTYLSRVEGLPATERIDNNDLGLVFS